MKSGLPTLLPFCLLLFLSHVLKRRSCLLFNWCCCRCAETALAYPSLQQALHALTGKFSFFSASVGINLKKMVQKTVWVWEWTHGLLAQMPWRHFSSRECSESKCRVKRSCAVFILLTKMQVWFCETKTIFFRNYQTFEVQEGRKWQRS